MVVSMMRFAVCLFCVIRSGVRVVASVPCRACILRSMREVPRGMVIVAVLCRMNRVFVSFAGMVFGGIRRNTVIVCVMGIFISVPVGIVGV